MIFTLLTTLLPSAFASDTSPPQLLDWGGGVSTTNADISKGDATVIIRFVLSDDSRIVSPNLLLKSLSTTQITSFATVKEIGRAEKLVSYEASAIIKYGQASGKWEWVLYPLSDEIGNSSTSFGPGSPWGAQVTVLDGVYTQAIHNCQQEIQGWNLQVQKFQALEAKYKGAQEISLARLQFPIPIETIQLDICTANYELYRTKYFQNGNLLTGLTNLAIAMDELKNIIATRVQNELDAQVDVADKVAKAAADKAAKVAADKVIADKAASELKIKQDAEKALSDSTAALSKSQADLNDANTALARANLIIASMQSQIDQLKAKTDAMQTQISSISAQFTSAQKSAATLSVQLKKICALKPKPKGC